MYIYIHIYVCVYTYRGMIIRMYKMWDLEFEVEFKVYGWSFEVAVRFMVQGVGFVASLPREFNEDDL